MDLTRPVEKKLLNEECWIELDDGVRIKIDYPTRSQEVELRRLQKIWFNGLANDTTEHWLAYYLRTTIKDVTGYTIAGKPTKLISDRGLARALVVVNPENDEEKKTLDIIGIFIQQDLIELLAGLIMQRLEVTEAEKKSCRLPPNSSSLASSAGNTSSSSPERKSSIPGSRTRHRGKKT